MIEFSEIDTIENTKEFSLTNFSSPIDFLPDSCSSSFRFVRTIGFSISHNVIMLGAVTAKSHNRSKVMRATSFIYKCMIYKDSVQIVNNYALLAKNPLTILDHCF